MPLEFEPEFTAGNDWVIPSQVISVTTNAQGLAAVDLWVITGRAVRWKVRTAIGYGFAVPERKFDLVLGDEIELADLVQAGTGNYPQPVYAYIDDRLDELDLDAFDANLVLIYEITKL